MRLLFVTPRLPALPCHEAARLVAEAARRVAVAILPRVRREIARAAVRRVPCPTAEAAA